MLLQRSGAFYERKLSAYFHQFYGEYEDTAEYYVNPNVNQWKFVIPELNMLVELTCYDDGHIVDKREYYEKK